MLGFRPAFRFPIRLVALLAAALLPACAGGGWIADHPDIAERARANPEAFVEPTFARWDGLETLSGAYQLRAARGIGRRTFDLAVSVRRPDQVDISVLDPTGAIQAYLRADSREIGLWFAEDRVLYRGPATRDAFERALGLDLSAADAVAVFLGYGLAADALSGRETAVWDEEARRVRVDAETRSRAWIHPLESRVDRVEHRSGAGVLEAEIREWSAVGAEGDTGLSYPIPSLVELSVEPDGIGLTLRLLASPRVGHDLPHDLFEIQVPPGTLELPLEELARQGGLFRRAGPEQESEPA